MAPSTFTCSDTTRTRLRTASVRCWAGTDVTSWWPAQGSKLRPLTREARSRPKRDGLPHAPACPLVLCQRPPLAFGTSSCRSVQSRGARSAVRPAVNDKRRAPTQKFARMLTWVSNRELPPTCARHHRRLARRCRHRLRAARRTTVDARPFHRHAARPRHGPRVAGVEAPRAITCKPCALLLRP